MTEPKAPPKVTQRYYQGLCGVALVAVFLLQWQQNLPFLLNMLMLFIGGVCILYPVRLTPILVLLAIAGAHLLEQYTIPDFRSFRFLELNDVLLCMATLTYLVGHYRLQALRFNLVPADKTRPRSSDSLTPGELVALIFTVPLAVLAAEFVVLILRQHWELVGLPPRWRQFLAIAWLLLIVMFVTAHAFRYLRRMQMSRALARMLLQDMVWNETRGEQRRIARWAAWWKLRQTKK